MLPFLIRSRLMKLLPIKCMMLTDKSRSVPVSGNGVLAFASVSDVPGKVIVDPGFGPELGLVVRFSKLNP